VLGLDLSTSKSTWNLVPSTTMLALEPEKEEDLGLQLVEELKDARTVTSLRVLLGIPLPELLAL